MLRRGYVAGEHDGWMLLDAQAFFGDSGAGIFDRSGQVVGVVSTLFDMDGFRMTGAKHIVFNGTQLTDAGL
jgi:S1-C subfamily serine protease